MPDRTASFRRVRRQRVHAVVPAETDVSLPFSRSILYGYLGHGRGQGPKMPVVLGRSGPGRLAAFGLQVCACSVCAAAIFGMRLVGFVHASAQACAPDRGSHQLGVCVCVRARACVRACVRAWAGSGLDWIQPGPATDADSRHAAGVGATACTHAIAICLASRAPSALHAHTHTHTRTHTNTPYAHKHTHTHSHTHPTYTHSRCLSQTNTHTHSLSLSRCLSQTHTHTHTHTHTYI